MTNLEKARLIINNIETDDNFDLIDYYFIEKSNPLEFVKSVRQFLSPNEVRTIYSFASRNVETSEWKERHYVMFFNSDYILSGIFVTKEDKEIIINNLLDLGLSINNCTVRVMMRRYVRSILENQNEKKILTHKASE